MGIACVADPSGVKEVERTWVEQTQTQTRSWPDIVRAPPARCRSAARRSTATCVRRHAAIGPIWA